MEYYKAEVYIGSNMTLASAEIQQIKQKWKGIDLPAASIQQFHYSHAVQQVSKETRACISVKFILLRLWGRLGKKDENQNCLQNNSFSSPLPHPSNMRYQWQKVMQIIATLSPVPWELGSSQWEGDK